jgi:hypothetical protein
MCHGGCTLAPSLSGSLRARPDLQGCIIASSIYLTSSKKNQMGSVVLMPLFIRS